MFKIAFYLIMIVFLFAVHPLFGIAAGLEFISRPRK